SSQAQVASHRSRVEKERSGAPSAVRSSDPMALALSTSAAAAAAAAARALAARVTTTRGYAASAASSAMRRAAAAVEGKGAAGMTQAKDGSSSSAAREVSWVPDPVTGHYRPSNFAGGADAADLRAAHLARSYARA
ncbi:UNVERIFIED_CONTAM: hypothetical protein KWG05_18955, partial [Acinetobacter baumannii]